MFNVPFERTFFSLIKKSLKLKIIKKIGHKKIQDGRHKIFKMSEIDFLSVHCVQHEKTKKKHIRVNSVGLFVQKLW